MEQSIHIHQAGHIENTPFLHGKILFFSTFYFIVPIYIFLPKETLKKEEKILDALYR